MITRRTLFGVGLCAWPARPKAHIQQFEPGDLVRIVALPDYYQIWESSKNTDLKWHGTLLRRCLAGKYRVIGVGDDGCLELDVFRTASVLNRSLVGCEISIEPECVALVAKQVATMAGGIKG